MIRPATPADLYAVLKIARRSFDKDEDTITPKWFLKVLADYEHALMVAAEPDGVAGFVLYTWPPSGAEVRLIATRPDARKRGVGSALLAAAPDRCGAWVREQNAASQAMFRKAGWTREGPAGGWYYFRKGA